MQVTLYSRPGCHLCEDVKADLAAVRQEYAFTLVERNIEDNADDLARYQYLIPVVDIAGGSMLYPPHSWATLVEALQTARQGT
jgi:hypothetical protein